MKKIVELLIDWDEMDFEDLGVEVMSIVDKPAIGIDFLAFSEHTFVEPKAGEAENDFISRCIPVLKGEGYDDAQSSAICYSYWEGEEKEEFDQEKAWAMVIEMAEELGETVDYENAVYIDATKTNFENIGDYVKGIVGLDILGRQDLDNEPETKYRYAGSLAAQRNFCKAMVRMNKLYTRDEINQMNTAINTGFRHNGQPYSIFDFKGGVNCNHYWEELEVYKDGRETVIMSKGRAAGRAGQVASSSND